MRKTNLQILEAELILCSRLKSEGFIIQRVVARTSNSVYLKLDYGMGNSVRISDHKSRKEGYMFKYDVGSHIKKLDRLTIRGHESRRYPLNEVNKMVKDAVLFKRECIAKCGISWYEEAMMLRLKNGKDSNLFWKLSNIV